MTESRYSVVVGLFAREGVDPCVREPVEDAQRVSRTQCKGVCRLNVYNSWGDVRMMELRAATRKDIPLLLHFLRLLAEYDGHPDSVTAKPEDLERHLFGAVPRCHAVIAERASKPVAFATYHFTFSTFSAQPVLWLDDLFVLEEERGSGVGRAILTRLSRIAVEEGCCRLNWIVNQSNDRGIAFYERIGAEVMPEYRLCCVDRHGMATLLDGAGS